MSKSLPPPRLAQALLRLCLHTGDVDVVLGDLDETYAHLCRRYGRREARRWYRSQVLRSMPRFSILTLTWSFVMLSNHFKIAFRNFIKQPGYTFINVFGLAAGIACFLLIVLYVQDELGFDRFHERADRIYRLVPDYEVQNGTSRFAKIGAPWGPALQETFPEVEQAVRFRYVLTVQVQRGEQASYERGGFFADPSVFDVFSFPLLRGDPNTALSAPNSIVLTQRMAERYFGTEDPMGQTLTLEGDDLVVTGVLEDLPASSHLTFDFLLPFARHEAGRPSIAERWGLYNYFTYLLLESPEAASALEAKLPAFETQHLGTEGARRTTARLQPLTQIHLYSHRSGEHRPGGKVTTLYALGAVAVFILLIACINFMNLATARSADRAREVGIRKVVGAHRGQLVGQFLGEAVLVCFLALLVGLLLVEAFLPAFNGLTRKELSMHYTSDALLLFGIAALGLVVGVLAGSYPAFYLSSFRPAVVLKGGARAGRSARRLRKGLVAVQFALSIVLLIGVSVVYQQVQYMQSKDLGFKQEQVVVIPMLRDEALRQNIETVSAAFAQTPGVEHVAATSGPIAGGDWGIQLRREGAPGSDEVSTRLLYIDYGFVPTMEIDLVAGRNLSPDFPADEGAALLINETAAQVLDLDDPIGQRLASASGTGTVVGVVKDFHFDSLHEEIAPLVLLYQRDQLHFFNVRVRPDQLQETLAGLEATWHRFVPERPFNYSFLNESFDRYYRAERRLGETFGYFTALALLIACLGLFGLASFTAEQRRKEVGIRKVMGATVAGILVLFSKDFLKLVALAFLLGAPVAYLVMQQWLNDFAYRVDISWPIFLLAGLTALGVALLTVSYQALRAALTNPVKVLRCE